MMRGCWFLVFQINHRAHNLLLASSQISHTRAPRTEIITHFRDAACTIYATSLHLFGYCNVIFNSRGRKSVAVWWWSLYGNVRDGWCVQTIIVSLASHMHDANARALCVQRAVYHLLNGAASLIRRSNRPKVRNDKQIEFICDSRWGGRTSCPRHYILCGS